MDNKKSARTIPHKFNVQLLQQEPLHFLRLVARHVRVVLRLRQADRQPSVLHARARLCVCVCVCVQSEPIRA